MLCKSLLAAVMLLATSAVASPLQKRYSDVTCGSTVYYAASIEKAVNAGCSYYQSSTIHRPSLTSTWSPWPLLITSPTDTTNNEEQAPKQAAATTPTNTTTTKASTSPSRALIRSSPLRRDMLTLAARLVLAGLSSTLTALMRAPSLMMGLLGMISWVAPMFLRQKAVVEILGWYGEGKVVGRLQMVAGAEGRLCSEMRSKCLLEPCRHGSRWSRPHHMCYRSSHKLNILLAFALRGPPKYGSRTCSYNLCSKMITRLEDLCPQL